jgi:hypothetical protein
MGWWTMDFRRFLKLVLAVLVTAGLASAPLVAPAAAERPSTVEMADMSAMSADMPCCPDKQKSKDCQDCPLVAMCVLKRVQASSSAAQAMPLRHPVRTVHSVLNDAPADGLSRPPPDHPPRNLA